VHPRPAGFDKLSKASPPAFVFEPAKTSALLPVLNTTPATPAASPSKVTFTLSPDLTDEPDNQHAHIFEDGVGLDRSTSMHLVSSPKILQASELSPPTLRKRCKSLPVLPPEIEVDAIELMRQFSEAALDDTFGSALRLNAHRMTLKIEQRYRALLELVETERDYVADLQIFIEVRQRFAIRAGRHSHASSAGLRK
jgi:hypothetical protein